MHKFHGDIGPIEAFIFALQINVSTFEKKSIFYPSNSVYAGLHV